MGFGGGAVLLLGGAAAFYRSDRKRRKERFARSAAELELKALRAQMNPHFLFNALASINDFVLDHEPELASAYLTKFTRLMRLVLENSRETEVPLAKDLEALRGLPVPCRERKLTGVPDAIDAPIARSQSSACRKAAQTKLARQQPRRKYKNKSKTTEQGAGLGIVLCSAFY